MRPTKGVMIENTHEPIPLNCKTLSKNSVKTSFDATSLASHFKGL
jgi:hypothetical protein